jgi:vacuolar-type H+-ATPase subunit I/STV1
MNKHFEDTRYYLKRATETATKGLREELEPIERRFKDLTGGEDEEEPEPSRIAAIREELKALEERAEGEAKEAIAEAREKLKNYREQRAE